MVVLDLGAHSMRCILVARTQAAVIPFTDRETRRHDGGIEEIDGDDGERRGRESLNVHACEWSGAYNEQLVICLWRTGTAMPRTETGGPFFCGPLSSRSHFCFFFEV